jgi:NAD(P)-dependent dehydrogenase (short-subunit alcohol dehydrogenase family)
MGEQRDDFGVLAVQEILAEEFRRVTEVTYLGVVHGTMAAPRRMLPRDRGAIVQVGSALAYRSIPLQSAYCRAKHAIRGFTDSLRCELLHDGSSVLLLAMAGTAAGMGIATMARWRRSRA